MSENLKRLEEKIAYLERHVVEQDKAMLEFYRALDALRRELKALCERPVRGAAGEASEEAGSAENERPPHY